MKAAQKFAQVTALNGVKICHRSLGETSKPAVLMIMGIAAARKSIVDGLHDIDATPARGVAVV